MDFAKSLLDYDFHAPTTYFPLLVPECLLIEPNDWHSMQGFSEDAILLILASEHFDPDDYIYEEYK